jgi:NAD(P)H dehydrogenase (quinone)
MYAVTGASGQLGQLVLGLLLEKLEAGSVVALARDPAKLASVADRGAHVRRVDYNAPETLTPALEGVDRLLFISSSDHGAVREAQHRAVISAAKAAGVKFVAYTSILHADTSPIGLAIDHRATEAALKASGLPYVLLRNGWYTENYVAQAQGAIANGVLLGSTGAGRISTASRLDYAQAAVAVLAGASTETRVYELAGDEALTLAEFAAVLAEMSGKPVVFQNLPETEYAAALEGNGFPPHIAALIADNSAKAASDTLFEDGRALSKLIGRPTTPMRQSVRHRLDGCLSSELSISLKSRS